MEDEEGAPQSPREGISELKDALADILEQRGVVDQIKARLRAEIFASLESDIDPPRETLAQNVVINELIKEYLEYNHYLNSSSVFLKESGHPEESPFDRNFLSEQLGVVDKSLESISEKIPGEKHQVPLLYGIVECLTQLKKDGGYYDQGTNMTQQHNKSGGTNATERTATTSAKRYSKTRNTINTRTSNKEQASHRREASESSSQPLSASTRAANFFEMNDPRRQEYISIFKAAGDLDDDKEGCGDGDQDGHDMEGRG